MNFEKEKHEEYIRAALEQPSLLSRLSPKYTGGDEEVKKGLQKAEESDLWSTTRFSVGGFDNVYSPEDYFTLDEVNAQRIGKPDWEGKWTYEYYCPTLDELSFILVCEDKEGEKILDCFPAVGGNIVPP